MATNRDLQIVYGDLTIGGPNSPGNTREPHGPLMKKDGRDFSSIVFEFGIHAATDALFEAEKDTVEAELRKPFKDLTVTIESEPIDYFTRKQSDDTGLDAEATWEILEEDQARHSARYRVTIQMERPADWTAGTDADPAGLRDATISVNYIDSRRKEVRIDTEFTAISGTAARAQYEAKIAAYATAVLNVIDSGATWQLVNEPETEATRNNKTIRTSRVYKALLETQGTANVRDQALHIRRRITAPGDTGVNVKRLKILDVHYEAGIDSDDSTDLRGEWNSILSFIAGQVRSYAGGGTLALIENHPDFDQSNNRIVADCTFWATGGSRILEQQIMARVERDMGKRLRDVYDGGDLSKRLYQSVGSKRLTITHTVTMQGTVQIVPAELKDGGAAVLRLAGLTLSGIKKAGEKIEHFNRVDDHHPVTWGSSPYQIKATQIKVVHTFEIFKASGGGAPTIASGPR